MNKEELLNAIIDITKASGQGLTDIVIKMNPNLKVHINALLEEGLIIENELKYNTLPDDVFYVPKDCYNVWKDEDFNALNYVRTYLDIHDLQEELLKDSKYMGNYNVWLEKNKEELEKMVNLKKVDFPNDTSKTEPNKLSPKALEFLKSRTWYKDNLTIIECLTESKEALDLDKTILDKTENLIEIRRMRNSSEDRIEIEKHLNALEELKPELELRREINHFLYALDPEKQIQSYNI